MKYLEVSTKMFFTLFFSIVLILIGGCSTSSVRENQHKPNELSQLQKVTVIHPGKLSEDVADCIEKTLSGFCPILQFYPHEEFVDTLFPWFEPGVAPESKEDLEALLKNRVVQDRISKLGVRYVIFLSGGTGHSSTRSEIFIPGLFGSVTISDEYSTDIWVTVCDLKELKLLLKTDSHERGSSYWGFVYVIPFLIPGRNTEDLVCDEIVEKLTPHLPGCRSTVDKQDK
jgi:hypothetical protein